MPPALHRAPEAELSRRLVFRAANRGEAFLSVARATFCLLVLLRMLWLEWQHPVEGPNLRLRFEAPLLAFAVLLSAYLGRRALGLKLGTLGLSLSAAADVVICTAALATNVLWPPVGYVGLLRMPDPAAFIAIVFVTVLRLSPVAAALSGGLALAGLTTLFQLDHALNPRAFSYGLNEVTAVGLFIVTAAGVAAVSAVAARRLVEASGREAARAEQARSGLATLLHDHHDVRSLLSSAQLQAQLLARAAADPGALSSLQRSLEEVTTFVEGVKTRALGEIAALDGASPVELRPVLTAVADTVGRRFPEVRVQVTAPEGVQASLLGGAHALAQAVTNLLVNACEGDGRRGARGVAIEASAEAGRVSLRISDDGPGFPPHLLAGVTTLGVTSKAEGSGLGLSIARSLIEASGGRLALANTEAGAEVTVALPSA